MMRVPEEFLQTLARVLESGWVGKGTPALLRISTRIDPKWNRTMFQKTHLPRKLTVTTRRKTDNLWHVSRRFWVKNLTRYGDKDSEEKEKRKCFGSCHHALDAGKNLLTRGTCSSWKREWKPFCANDRPSIRNYDHVSCFNEIVEWSNPNVARCRSITFQI